MTIEAKLINILIMNQTTEKAEEELKINYSKYNPFVWSDKQKNCKNFRKISLILQLIMATVIAIFSLISLWYATQWGKDTLTHLGIDLTKYENFFIGEAPKDLASGTNVMIIAEKDFKAISSLALYDWNTTKWMSVQLLDALVGFSFAGLFLILPLLSFKRGTLVWTIVLSTMLILLIGIIIIFTFGLIDQQQIVSVFNSSNKKNFEDAKKIVNLIDPNIQLSVSTTK